MGINGDGAVNGKPDFLLTIEDGKYVITMRAPDNPIKYIDYLKLVAKSISDDMAGVPVEIHILNSDGRFVVISSLK